MTFVRNITAALVLLGMASSGAVAQSPAEIVRQHHQATAATIVADFREFLSIPNVASNVSDMHDNAAFIQEYIASRGFTSKVCLLAVHPTWWPSGPARMMRRQSWSTHILMGSQ